MNFPKFLTTNTTAELLENVENLREFLLSI